MLKLRDHFLAFSVLIRKIEVSKRNKKSVFFVLVQTYPLYVIHTHFMLLTLQYTINTSVRDTHTQM